MRKPVRLGMTLSQVAALMSEGNPGALSVVAQMVQDANGLLDLMSLDDMGMRGPQIWVGFKDYAKGDLDRFLTAVRIRDPQMIEVVNQECPDLKAVIYGASR